MEFTCPTFNQKGVNKNGKYVGTFGKALKTTIPEKPFGLNKLSGFEVLNCISFLNNRIGNNNTLKLSEYEGCFKSNVPNSVTLPRVVLGKIW